MSFKLLEWLNFLSRVAQKRAAPSHSETSWPKV